MCVYVYVYIHIYIYTHCAMPLMSHTRRVGEGDRPTSRFWRPAKQRQLRNQAVPHLEPSFGFKGPKAQQAYTFESYPHTPTQTRGTKLTEGSIVQGSRKVVGSPAQASSRGRSEFRLGILTGMPRSHQQGLNLVRSVVDDTAHPGVHEGALPEAC